LFVIIEENMLVERREEVMNSFDSKISILINL
jgi:hypothetical protein